MCKKPIYPKFYTKANVEKKNMEKKIMLYLYFFSSERLARDRDRSSHVLFFLFFFSVWGRPGDAHDSAVGGHHPCELAFDSRRATAALDRSRTLSFARRPLEGRGKGGVLGCGGPMPRRCSFKAHGAPNLRSHVPPETCAQGVARRARRYR